MHTIMVYNNNGVFCVHRQGDSSAGATARNREDAIFKFFMRHGDDVGIRFEYDNGKKCVSRFPVWDDVIEVSSGNAALSANLMMSDAKWDVFNSELVLELRKRLGAVDPVTKSA